jgi:MFS family permease
MGRDGGYAVGALIAGILADLLGVPWAIGGIAALAFASGLVVLICMYETLPARRRWERDTADRDQPVAPASGTAR